MSRIMDIRVDGPIPSPGEQHRNCGGISMNVYNRDLGTKRKTGSGVQKTKLVITVGMSEARSSDNHQDLAIDIYISSKYRNLLLTLYESAVEYEDAL